MIAPAMTPRTHTTPSGPASSKAEIAIAVPSCRLSIEPMTSATARVSWATPASAGATAVALNDFPSGRGRDQAICYHIFVRRSNVAALPPGLEMEVGRRVERDPLVGQVLAHAGHPELAAGAALLPAA